MPLWTPDATALRRGSAIPASLIAIAFVVYVFLVAGRVGSPEVTRAIDDCGQAAAALIAGAAGAWQARRSTGRFRMAWALIGAACACWGIGEAIWTAYELGSRQTPFPSVADIGFLLFPVLALPGLLFRPSAAFAGLGRGRLVLDGVIVAASLFTISWVTVLSELFHTRNESTFALAVGLAYPISDLVLITVGVLVVAQARARDGLLLLTCGLVGMAVADSSFSYLTATGTYHTGSFVDFGWTAAFSLIALSALRHHDTVSRQPRATISAAYLTLPYFLVVAGIAVASQKIIEGSRTSLTVSTLAIIALLIRQLLTLLENRALTQRVAEQHDELRHQAFHDALTGLANRALFVDRLGHALELHRRDLRPLAVLFCDLDDFKMINDTLGHDAGDAVLTAVSERLRATVRTGDTVARLGGDEFAVLVEDGGSALELASRLLAAFSVPVHAYGRDIPVRASVGIAEVDPGDVPVSVEELLRKADIAMYAAKRSGKDTSIRWTPALRSSDPDDLDLRLDLAAAIAEHRLQVAYQPIMMFDGSVYGFEALARWQRDNSPVAPDVFIPIADRAGLLPDLDLAVISQAMRRFHEERTPGFLSVNIGLSHLADPTLPQRLDAVMRACGTDPHRLVVEVPESQAIDRPEILASLLAIRRRGIRIALDDFGVGYSNLSRISTLSPDVIKLDRSFVVPLTESTRHADFVAGIIELGHRIGAVIVAEGVETVAQLTALRDLRCDAVQGYLLGRPSEAPSVPRESLQVIRGSGRPPVRHHAGSGHLPD